MRGLLRLGHFQSNGGYLQNTLFSVAHLYRSVKRIQILNIIKVRVSTQHNACRNGLWYYVLQINPVYYTALIKYESISVNKMFSLSLCWCFSQMYLVSF